MLELAAHGQKRKEDKRSSSTRPELAAHGLKKKAKREVAAHGDK